MRGNTHCLKPLRNQVGAVDTIIGKNQDMVDTQRQMICDPFQHERAFIFHRGEKDNFPHHMRQPSCKLLCFRCAFTFGTRFRPFLGRFGLVCANWTDFTIACHSVDIFVVADGHIRMRVAYSA
jgi:hypothetical protein